MINTGYSAAASVAYIPCTKNTIAYSASIVFKIFRFEEKFTLK